MTHHGHAQAQVLVPAIEIRRSRTHGNAMTGQSVCATTTTKRHLQSTKQQHATTRIDPPRKSILHMSYLRRGWSAESYAHARVATATSLACEHEPNEYQNDLSHGLQDIRTQYNLRPPQFSSSALRLAPKKSG